MHMLVTLCHFYATIQSMATAKKALSFEAWKTSLPQSVGLEPTLPEGNWFLVSRLNHSATTAGYQHSAQTVDRPATDSRQKAIVSSEVAERGYQPKLQ